MRTYAGELVTTDIFTDGRMMFGVGRGAFGFEMDRLGVPLVSSREKFDESLNVVMTLLNSNLVILEGLKHSIRVEGPDRVIPHIKEFLLPELLRDEGISGYKKRCQK